MQVRMLGTGRPFLVEIQNARQFPSDLLIKEIEMNINSLESKFVCPNKVDYFVAIIIHGPSYGVQNHCLVQVRVKNLRFLGSQGWDLMREGEAEKQVTFCF